MGYNYAARLCLAAAIDIQHGEIVGWKVESGYKLWLIRKNAKTEKKKKTPEGVFQQNRLLCLTPATRAANHGIHRPAAQVSGMKIVSGFICFFAHFSAKHPLFTRPMVVLWIA